MARARSATPTSRPPATLGKVSIKVGDEFVAPDGRGRRHRRGRLAARRRAWRERRRREGRPHHDRRRRLPADPRLLRGRVQHLRGRRQGRPRQGPAQLRRQRRGPGCRAVGRRFGPAAGRRSPPTPRPRSTPSPAPDRISSRWSARPGGDPGRPPANVTAHAPRLAAGAVVSTTKSPPAPTRSTADGGRRAHRPLAAASARAGHVDRGASRVVPLARHRRRAPSSSSCSPPSRSSSSSRRGPR